MSDRSRRRRLAAAGAVLLVVAAGAAVVAVGGAGLPGVGGTAPASASFPDGDPLTLPAKDGAVVRANTTLSPGSTVTVRLRATGRSPFLKSREATVAENGSVRATFDLSGVRVGTDVTASIRAGGSELASANGTVVAPADGTRVAYSGDTLTVRPAAGQVIRGTTAREPGTTLVVRVKSTGENPFLKSREVTVAENRTFRATFDFSGTAANATFTVRVLTGDGTELASAEGVVRA